MTTQARADVIVVGGGPAGASVATWLARAGQEVVLLDRARFPRDKACGEFLTPAACRLLCDMGAWEAVLAAGARPVARITLIAPDGTQARHTPEEAGYALRRTVLDRVLLEQARQAGVVVREGFTARTLCRDAEGRVTGVTGQTDAGESGAEEMRARLVIGADGAHSRVARQLGLARALPRL